MGVRRRQLFVPLCGSHYKTSVPHPGSGQSATTQCVCVCVCEGAVCNTRKTKLQIPKGKNRKKLHFSEKEKKMCPTPATNPQCLQSQTTTKCFQCFYKVILSSHSLGKPSGAGEESSSIRYAVLLGNTLVSRSSPQRFQ